MRQTVFGLFDIPLPAHSAEGVSDSPMDESSFLGESLVVVMRLQESTFSASIIIAGLVIDCWVERYSIRKGALRNSHSLTAIMPQPWFAVANQENTFSECAGAQTR